MNHTPGPWEAQGYLPESYRVHPQGNPQYQTATPDEFFANVRLIAAAPELLEACKVALREVESMERFTSFRVGADLYDISDMLKAAIAKAEGDNSADQA